MGSNYNELKLDSVQSNYWTTRYRLEAIIELRQLLDETMIPATFTNITQPVFMGYYYESDAAMDSTVSVSAMLEMYDQLGTPGDKKVKVAFPNVRDHVIGCQLTSKDLGSVRTETIQFLEQVVGLQPVGEKTALEGSAQVFWYNSKTIELIFKVKANKISILAFHEYPIWKVKNIGWRR